MRTRDNATLFRPAAPQMFHPPDDLCLMLTSLHCLVALGLDLYHVSLSFNTVIMPLKTKMTAKTTRMCMHAVFKMAKMQCIHPYTNTQRRGSQQCRSNIV